jgi:succinoglycan biosynthesis transport protein ExoP
MRAPRLSKGSDYLALFVRRKWWILIPSVALSAMVLLFTYLLPSAYVSETLILIQPRDIPRDLVRDLISGTTDQRLNAIKQIVLSRTNLLQILNQFESGFKEFQGLNDEQKVAKLRDRIDVKIIAERKGTTELPVSYFRISYQNTNPELAQKITSRLASLFIEQDNRVRETQVFGTTEFLSTELNKVAEELRQSAAKVTALKERYRNELPDQLQTNLRTLDRLGLQKQANGEALDRYVSLRLTFERQISETPPVITRDAVENRGSSNSRAPNPLVEDHRKKELAYHEMVAKYKSKHPEVIRAKAELDRLKQEIPPEDLVEVENTAGPQTFSVSVPNPIFQRLTAQLREVKTEIEIREKEKKWIESQIESISRRVQDTPRSEEVIASVRHNHTELTKRYEGLKDRLSEAKLSESLESRQKGSNFVIVDPANYPLMPTKPNRGNIILWGVALSFGLGLVLALFVDFSNPKVWTQGNIENLLGVPVLVEIPEIVTIEDRSVLRKRRIAHAALFFLFTAIYVASLYFIYIHQSSVLRRLDPIVDRLMS